MKKTFAKLPAATAERGPPIVFFEDFGGTRSVASVSPWNLRCLAVFAFLCCCQGIVIAQTGTLTYPLKDNLELRHGTLECWVQFGI